MGAGTGTAGDVLSGVMPNVKDDVLVIGHGEARQATVVFVADEVRRGDAVLVGKAGK